MHTAYSSSHLGGLHPAPPGPEPPKDQTPLAPESPGTRPLPEAGTNPLGPDPLQKQNPPQEQAPPCEQNHRHL